MSNVSAEIRKFNPREITSIINEEIRDLQLVLLMLQVRVTKITHLILFITVYQMKKKF